MAIKSSMKHADNGGTPHTHQITLWVAYQTGGGPPGTTVVDVTISWDPNELGQPSNVSPAGSTMSAGAAVWTNVSVDQTGTSFSVTLQCTRAGSGLSLVRGLPVEVNGQGRPPQYAVLTNC